MTVLAKPAAIYPTDRLCLHFYFENTDKVVALLI
jgi:hypothetical protein